MRAPVALLAGVLAFTALTGVPPAAADTWTANFNATSGTGAIPDAGSTTCGAADGRRDVTIPVAGLPTTRRLTDVFAAVQFTHNFASDVIIDLVPPGSTYPAANSLYVRLFGTTNCTPNSGADFNGTYQFQTGFGSLPAAVAAAGGGVIPPAHYAPRDPMSRLGGIFNPNGNWRIVMWDTDQGGTGSVTGAAIAFQQDTTAPVVSFTGGPANEATVTTNPTYTFSASGGDVSAVQCSVDGGGFTPCSSPRTLNLGLGVHTLGVRAIDTSNNVSTTVTRQYNQVADPPPDTEITSGPADGSTVSTMPTFVFGSADTDIQRFECRLDGGAWSTCTSPHSEEATGAHTFEVRAVDNAGQVDGTPAARSYTYTPIDPDTTAPNTQISSGPSDGARVKKVPMYGFVSPDPDVMGFECAVDGGSFDPCASPFQVGVSPGTHTFAVRAYDAALNYDATPATRTFTLRNLCRESKDTLKAARQKLHKAQRAHASKAKIRRLQAAVNRAKAAVANHC